MKQFELDAIVDSLDNAGGSGTWHISLYIRPDKSIQSVRNRILQEISEAESIKSDDTRERVQSSLEKIDSALSGYEETPENGLVVFASPDSVTVLDSLPFDCPENRYHCGKNFLLDPIRIASDTGGTYGLIVVERGEASVGVLNSGRLESVTEMQSQVMGKTKAGGQSQTRFERVREKQKHEFFKSVQETAENIFSEYGTDGVVIGGTLNTAKEFGESYTAHNWDVLGKYSVDHGDKQGLSELSERAEKRLLEEDEASVREGVRNFLSGLRDDSVSYGQPDVDRALQNGRVELLLLSNHIPAEELRSYTQKAEQYGTSVEIVPDTFENARMFKNISNGYGAILRW